MDEVLPCVSKHLGAGSCLTPTMREGLLGMKWALCVCVCVCGVTTHVSFPLDNLWGWGCPSHFSTCFANRLDMDIGNFLKVWKNLPPSSASITELGDDADAEP